MEKKGLIISLKKTIDANFLLYVDKEKTQTLSSCAKLQLLGAIPQSFRFNTIVHESENIVNENKNLEEKEMEKDLLKVEKPFEFEYMMLSRLQSDCEYYLGSGGQNAEHALYYHDEKKHIEEMKKIYDILPIKPEWLTEEKLKEYEKLLLNKEEAENSNTKNYKSFTEVKEKAAERMDNSINLEEKIEKILAEKGRSYE